MSFWKLLWLLIFPGGLLLGGAYGLLDAGIVPAQASGLIEWYLPAVLAAGLLLGWRFSRSRLVLALAVLALAERGLAFLPTGVHQSFLFQAGAILVPLNLLLVACYRERGLWSPMGILRIFILPSQVLILYVLHLAVGDDLTVLLSRAWLPLKEFSGLTLSQPALVVFLMAALASIWRFLVRSGPFEGAFPWAMGASLMAFLDPASAGFWLATGGLILCAALAESLFSLAYDDELTGLRGRRSLNEHLERIGGLFTVAMIDVDRFKRVNDRYGHQVGDQVLKMVAGRLRLVSGGAKAFRYGGEEFCLVFPGKTSEEALPHLEELRRRVSRTEFVLRDSRRPKEKPEKPLSSKKTRDLAVTISIGTADRTGSRKKTTEVIKAADKALYKAKKGGRNQVRKA